MDNNYSNNRIDNELQSILYHEVQCNRVEQEYNNNINL